MRRILSASFFAGDTAAVARRLLGMFLVRKIGGKETAAMITETECYDGPYDRASHASRGKTPRTAVMFGDPGVWYVYLCYGMHEMLNIVTREKGYPAAVLIRAARPFPDSRVDLDGPGKLTKRLGIDRRQNGKRADRRTGLWIEDRGIRPRPRDIRTMPRVGVAYAGSHWAAKLLRFVLLRGTGQNRVAGRPPEAYNTDKGRLSATSPLSFMTTHVIKSDGSKAAFESRKVVRAITRAAADAGLAAGEIDQLVRNISDTVMQFVDSREKVRTLEIRDLVLAELDRLAPSVSAAWRRFAARGKK